MKISEIISEARDPKDYKYPVNPHTTIKDPEELQRWNDLQLLHRYFGNFLGRAAKGEVSAALANARYFLLSGGLKKPRNAEERRAYWLLQNIVDDDGHIAPKEGPVLPTDERHNPI